MLLYQILASALHGKHTKTPTWNDKFELRDESYSALDTQDYFEDIIKKHETLTDNPLRKTYLKQDVYKKRDYIQN